MGETGNSDNGSRRGYNTLSDKTIKAVRGLPEVQRLFDRRGDGLYLHVGKVPDDATEEQRNNPSKSWMVRYRLDGKRREKGLGSFRFVSLQEARNRAHDVQRKIRQGIDPFAEERAAKEKAAVIAAERIEVRRTKSKAIPFHEATHRVHKRNLPTWKNPKHGELWINGFRNHVFDHIGDIPVHEVETKDVLRVLEPIWTTKYDTARRLRQRMAQIFDWAKVAGFYKGENPARWEGHLEHLLPKMTRNAKNRAALPWKELPGFMADVAKHTSVSAYALQFLIHTCVRSGELRGATWDEIDTDAGVWVIPAERMKMDREHRIPLTPEALAILDKVRGLDDTVVFPTPNPRKGKVPVLSENALTSFMKKSLERTDCTPHGFRSTFKDWASDAARAQWELSEMALAHRVGDAVERAYARSDLYDRRAELMALWSRHATGKSAEVISLAKSNAL
mgnify:CR=1 FL=1